MEAILSGFEIDATKPVNEQIGGFLRRQIETGRLTPGARLPSTADLARRWRVNTHSIQRAMKPLVAQGFVERRQKSGTFVCERSLKTMIAVVFGPSLADETAHYYRGVWRAVQEHARSFNWSCRLYDGVNFSAFEDQPQYRETVLQLKHDIAMQGFAGQLHIAGNPAITSTFMRETGLPVTTLDTEVVTDRRQVGRDMAAYLKAAGRTRVLCFSSVGLSVEEDDFLQGLKDGARASGGMAVDVVRQESSPLPGVREAATQAQFARLVADWRSGAAPMPDSLAFSDDIMLRAAALALLQHGVRVPEDVLPVVMTSNRVQLHYGFPVVRYAVSVDEKARQILRLLWNRILDEPLPELPIIVQGAFRPLEI